jgi:hypothetical protein
MSFLFLVGVLIVIWWFVTRWMARKTATLVMDKWIEMGNASLYASNNPSTTEPLAGKLESLSDFRFEYAAAPAKVIVTGTGRFLGFRGDITDDGHAIVWYEKGSPWRVKRLVRAMTAKFQGIINGNEYPTSVHQFAARAAATPAPATAALPPPATPQTRAASPQ